jgi:hypothetical protein
VYRLVDVDNHYYEPDDCFTRHLDPAFADRAFHIERAADGLGRPYFGSDPAYYLLGTPTVVDALSNIGSATSTCRPHRSGCGRRSGPRPTERSRGT